MVIFTCKKSILTIILSCPVLSCPVLSCPVLSCLIAGCMGPTTRTIKPNDAAVAIEARKQRELVLRESIETSKRLHNLSWPILKAGLSLCEENTQKSIGFHAANKYDFSEENQDIVVSELGMGEPVQVLYVVRGSPADVAGLKADDILLAIDSYDVPVGEDATKKLIEHLSENTGDSVEFRVKRGDVDKKINILTEEQCDYSVVLSGDTVVNAYADGENIIVTQGMMEFAREDDELALVLGHELAHNVMGHIDKKQINALGGAVLDILIAVTTGVDTGAAFTKAAAGVYSQEFESEADYVGLYIAELAGHDISNAPHFWRRMGVKHPGSIDKNHAASHPSTPERFVAIEASIEEIENKKKTGEALMPNIDIESVSEEKRESTRDSAFNY